MKKKTRLTRVILKECPRHTNCYILLIVLSDNLYKIGVEDISNTTVLLTMMDGRITYAEPSIAAAGPLADPKIKYSWQE